jgi:hypothetical protein
MGKHLLSLPVMHGYAKRSLWSIAGTGRKLRKIQKHWESQRNFNPDTLDCNLQVEFWEKVVPLDFLKAMFSEKFPEYICPQCDCHI